MFGGLDKIDIEGVCMYIRYISLPSGFLLQNLQPKQRRRDLSYIGNAKLLRQASKGQRGLRGGQGLLEKLGQLVGFLRKPRQGVKASSRSLEQRVQKRGPKVVKGSK